MDELFALGNVPDWNEIFEITLCEGSPGAEDLSVHALTRVHIDQFVAIAWRCPFIGENQT
jgi:hypothetical protein